MGREFELKFRAEPAQQDAIIQRLGDFSSIRMETTYFDTPGGALSARHMTLRRRLENGKSLCSLKTPDGIHGRGEWETEQEDISEAVFTLCKLSGISELSVCTTEGLIPVCGARFTRLAKTLVLSHCTVELALDRGVLMGGGREMPLCEIEVELKSGSEEAAVAYAEALAAEYGLIPEPYSKFRRAMALAAGE